MMQNLPQKELRALSKTFNQPIVRNASGETLHRLIETPPELTAWLIMGSDDLIQVERMAHQWIISRQKPKLIIFSGHGPTFSFPEADIMEAHFKKIIQGQFVETLKERESMNSGENAEFVKVKLQNYKTPILHFVISGTPPAITRQVLTVEEHFKANPSLCFETIAGYPPSLQEVSKTYFQSEESKATYHLLALKEAASFLNYSINTDFMAPWSPPETEVFDLINTLNDAAYALGGPPKIKAPEKFAHDFVRYISLKSARKEPLDLSFLKQKLSPQIEPLATFFSKVLYSASRL